jgi:hypothetical protein
VAEETIHLSYERDWYLQVFVMMAETANIGVSVTLNVGGILVSGALVSSKKYFDGISKSVSEALPKASFSPDSIKTMEENLAAPGKAMEEIAKDETTSPREYTYIHLADAHFYSPSGDTLTEQRDIFWRGKLSSVDGFILGEPKRSS